MQIQDALGDWSAGPGPLYGRLAAALREAIGRGDIPPGTALPPERSLAKRLAIGRGTVVAAYARLREAELVDSRQGSSTWVRGAARHAAGEPPREALRMAALRDGATLIDLATTALPALRRALAARLTGQGLPTTPDQVLVTTGDQQALSLLCAHALHPGDTAVVEDPTSPGILDVLHGLPVAVRGARPVTADRHDLVRLIDRCQARLAYLTPTLGPEGQVLSPADGPRFARALAQRSALVVDDTSQAGLTFQPAPPPLAAHLQAPNLVTVGALTKLHWGGLRLGWIRGPAPLIASLTRAKVRADLGSPVLDQVLAVRLVGHEEQVRAERMAALRAWLTHATTVLTNALPEFSWRAPDGGLSLWLRLPAGTATAFAEVATRVGVAVVPGALLSPQGAADDHIRLVYARPTEVFDEGVRRLAAAWNHYQRAATISTTDYPPTPVLT